MPNFTTGNLCVIIKLLVLVSKIQKEVIMDYIQTTQDKIVKIKNSKIQHGMSNDRIYLMHLEKSDLPYIIDELDNLSQVQNYSKIFAKVQRSECPSFLEKGYVSEAIIPGFFRGLEECVFMSKYFDPKRGLEIDRKLNSRVLSTAISKRNSKATSAMASSCKDFSFRLALPEDAFQMANLYSNVFDSYPFPVFDPEYIKSTMAENIVYFCLWKDDELAGVSSCEMDVDNLNVEMTDFAVLPKYRGKNISLSLLYQMDIQMKQRGIKTAYTIARANSFGMNITFSKCGYTFAGRLVKNTQIGGTIEDMNVWYKQL